MLVQGAGVMRPVVGGRCKVRGLGVGICQRLRRYRILQYGFLLRFWFWALGFIMEYRIRPSFSLATAEPRSYKKLVDKTCCLQPARFTTGCKGGTKLHQAVESKEEGAESLIAQCPNAPMFFHSWPSPQKSQEGNTEAFCRGLRVYGCGSPDLTMTPQRTQYSLIKEDTLDHNTKAAPII